MQRLQKVLARAGIASRRKSEELIVSGRVRVNGQVVSELGSQVDPTDDRIEVDGETIRSETMRYVILHKPKGYLSDNAPSAAREAMRGRGSEQARSKPLAVDCVPLKERLYPAGRLDGNSEGLLLLTNDGDLAHRITHPRYGHEKEYLVLVQGVPTEETLARLRKGVWYVGDLLRADAVRIERHLGRAAQRQQHWTETGRDQCWLRIVLHEGKKREIRHLCGSVGHPVLRLIRVRIGPIELGTLRVGKWRELSPAEVRELKKGTLRKKTT